MLRQERELPSNTSHSRPLESALHVQILTPVLQGPPTDFQRMDVNLPGLTAEQYVPHSSQLSTMTDLQCITFARNVPTTYRYLGSDSTAIGLLVKASVPRPMAATGPSEHTFDTSLYRAIWSIS